MTSEKQRRLMQEALDELLPQDLQQELDSYLDQDRDIESEFNQLRRVHNMLQAAPYERAPRRLAATIMARLAEGVKAGTQHQTQSSPYVHISQEIISVALALVTVATMPLLIAASWMVINAMADPALLTMVLYQIVGLLLMVLEVMEVFLDKAQEVAKNDPQMAMGLLSLIPVTLLTIVRYLLDDPQD